MTVDLNYRKKVKIAILREHSKNFEGSISVDKQDSSYVQKTAKSRTYL